MPDRVYAQVQRMQPPRLDPPIDRVLPYSDIDELPPRHHPVLLVGERGDLGILSASPR